MDRYNQGVCFMAFPVVDPWSQTTAMIPSTPDRHQLASHSTLANSGEDTKALFPRPNEEESRIHGFPGPLLPITGDEEIIFSNSVVNAKGSPKRRFFSNLTVLKM